MRAVNVALKRTNCSGLISVPRMILTLEALNPNMSAAKETAVIPTAGLRFATLLT
jgi:hypothetical protein